MQNHKGYEIKPFELRISTSNQSNKLMAHDNEHEHSSIMVNLNVLMYRLLRGNPFQVGRGIRDEHNHDYK